MLHCDSRSRVHQRANRRSSSSWSQAYQLHPDEKGDGNILKTQGDLLESSFEKKKRNMIGRHHSDTTLLKSVVLVESDEDCDTSVTSRDTFTSMTSRRSTVSFGAVTIHKLNSSADHLDTMSCNLEEFEMRKLLRAKKQLRKCEEQLRRSLLDEYVALSQISLRQSRLAARAAESKSSLEGGGAEETTGKKTTSFFLRKKWFPLSRRMKNKTSSKKGRFFTRWRKNFNLSG